MPGVDDDADLSLGSSVAVGTLVGGVIGQGVVLLRRHGERTRPT